MKPQHHSVTSRVGACPLHGCACLALNAFYRSLRDADRLARRVSPDFEMRGEGALEGCADGCVAKFTLAPSGVAVVCETKAHASMLS